MATRTTPKGSEIEPPDLMKEAIRIMEPDAIGGVAVDREGKPLSLHGRLAYIIANLPEVKPEGTNDHFKYKFVTDKQVLGLVRPRLAAQQIVIYPEAVEESPFVELTTQRGGHSMLTRLHVTFRVVDALKGESFTGEAVGYGDDSGDKGANKAYTAALKNFLIKLFLMGGADRDIEDDPETDRRARARETGVEPVKTVEITDTVIENVARGGRSQVATAAQVTAVSRLVGELGITTPQAMAKIIDRALQFQVEVTTWPEVRKVLEALAGSDIGKLIEFMSEMRDADDESQGEPEDVGAK